MTETRIGAAPGKNANDSRRAGLRSCERRHDPRKSWKGPILRTGRAIDSSLRLLGYSRRVIDACESLALEHPVLATRQLERVAGLLAKVAHLLESGVDGLNETTNRVALSPAEAGDAPQRVIAATQRWVDAAAQLAALSNRLDDTFAGLVDYLKGGTAPLDLSEVFAKDGPAPLFITTRPSVRVLSIESGRIFCIHLRRLRSARLTVAEAPRRVVRGRAPPLVSSCWL
ncbi:MAG TPA: hypothetical protein VNN08_09750 [Thermoanaerobaculia bacterium]|nr:hypothetical protein [Thermoanaerobaculia bacterium]